MQMKEVSTIDEYIKLYPKEVQHTLQELRKVIKEAAPQATEAISYGLPTFKLHGKNLVHFGAYKTHIGFYPTPSGIDEFKDELSPYISGKGTVTFPLNADIPFNLILRIVRFRTVDEIKRAKKKNLIIK